MDKYGVQIRIAGDPVFSWWIRHLFDNHNRIIGKLKSKYWFRKQNFSVNIPNSVQEAKAFVEDNGNTLWWDAICKEMKNIRPDFQVWEKDISELPPGYQNITCHMIFDVNMGNTFRRKVLFVSDEHKTKTPASMTYSSVVSRCLVRIALKIAALNELYVLACYIQNTYLTVDCRERVWVVSGPKFGSEAGKNMMEEFNIRNKKIEPPGIYLGDTLAKMQLYSVKVTYINQLG